ncbi:DUF413 domain-containing protein, partial [Vibrio lentus]
MNDEELYLQATNEVDNISRNEALWAKSMALTTGDEKLAKYKYINLRVEQLRADQPGSLEKVNQTKLSDAVKSDSMYYNLENVEVIKILNQPFNDFKNFPRGFAKSGDFTIAQSQILESFGNALIALRDGVELTGIELRGKKIEALGSTPEALKAWNKYSSLINKTKAGMFLGGGKSMQRGEYFGQEPQFDHGEDREAVSYTHLT